MALINRFKAFFGIGGKMTEYDMYCVDELNANIFYKQLAINAGINLIANTVARSEFITYSKGKEVKKDNYYLLNIEPNQNQNSSKFWRHVISKLIYDNKCLILMKDNQLYVVDSFEVEKFAFKENVYSDIEIGDLKLTRTYKESEVINLEWHEKSVIKIINSLYSDYGKLIDISNKNYKKSKTNKGVLEIPSSYPQTDQAQTSLKDLLDNRFKKFFESEGDSLLPLTNGLKYENANEKGLAKDESSRETRKFIDDIFDFVAIGLQISPSLLKGDVQDTNNAMNNLLTFCVNPIAEVISDELNRKMFGKELFLERTYAKLDTSKIKVVDLKDIANALDVLTRIGAYTINDSLRALGMEPIEEEFSKIRYMTKNYEPVEEMIKGVADNDNKDGEEKY